MSVKKQTGIWLTEEDKAFLNEMGGVSKGIRFLIEEKREKMEGISRVKTVEEKFMERLITPSESHLKELYVAFLIAHLQRGGGMGSLDFFQNTLCAATGFDPKTVRKMFRKLEQSKFIKNKDFLFRPTIRLVDEEASKGFQEIFEDYTLFIQKAEQYTDWLEISSESIEEIKGKIVEGKIITEEKSRSFLKGKE